MRYAAISLHVASVLIGWGILVFAWSEMPKTTNWDSRKILYSAVLDGVVVWGLVLVFLGYGLLLCTPEKSRGRVILIVASTFLAFFLFAAAL